MIRPGNGRPLAHNRLVRGSSPPEPTILVLCSCVFDDLSRDLSNPTPRLAKPRSPSTLHQLCHGLARHALAVGGFGIPLHLTQRGVAGDRGYLVCRASDFRKPAGGG